MYVRRLIKAAALSCALALYGCASNVNPVTGKMIFTPLLPSMEAYYGGKANEEMIASRGAYTDDADLSAYVERVGQAVAKGAVRKSVKYTFQILDSDDVNAYALPGGYVYVTRGALSFANSEAELAGILGHEIGHVDAFHFKNEEHDDLKALLSVLLRNSSSDTLDLLIAEKLAEASAQSSAYSQDQEFEADALGIHYMAQAGYDPQALVNVMLTESAQSRLNDDDLKGNAAAHQVLLLDQSHPQTPERVARATDEAKAALVNLAVDPAVSPTTNPDDGRESYLAAIDGMMFGPDPVDGVVEGRQLIHSARGFSFAAPQGFDLWPLHSKTIGLSDKAYMILEMHETLPAGSLVDYVRNSIVEDASVENVRALDVPGMKAATGVINILIFKMRVAAIRDEANHLYHLAFVAPTRAFEDLDKDFIASIESFRHIEPAETSAAPKTRLHVVTVGAGDTVESLAQQMAVKDKKLEWFRVLNGLSETDDLKPGQKVKIAVAQ